MNLMDILNSNVVVKILPMVLILNVCLSGLSMILKNLADKGLVHPNQAIQVLAKIADGLQKVVDFVSANQKH
jgi:hypothetical protein